MKRIILNLFAAAALLSSTLGAANAQEKSMKNVRAENSNVQKCVKGKNSVKHW